MFSLHVNWVSWILSLLLFEGRLEKEGGYREFVFQDEV